MKSLFTTLIIGIVALVVGYAVAGTDIKQVEQIQHSIDVSHEQQQAY